MRLLLDANLSPRLTVGLTDAGHDVVHVADIGLLASDDETIAACAARDDRILITSDSDFGEILARLGTTSPSILLLREERTATLESRLLALSTALESSAEALSSGAVVTWSRGRVRVRRLPLRR